MTGKRFDLMDPKYEKLEHLLKHFGAVLAMTSEKPYKTPLHPGIRVIRGPDWKWGDQDGGEGQVGTIAKLGSKEKDSEDVVILQWDNGHRTNYRTGHQGSFDLRVYDNASAGIYHKDAGCSGCGTPSIFGIRFGCADCESKGRKSVNLCSLCYHSDKHDLSHKFIRYDCPNSTGTFILGPREHSRKVQIKGIFPGATVIRSFNWIWKDQDGSKREDEFNPGKVLNIEGWEAETARSVAKVCWQGKSGQNFDYRMGHRGKIDLQYLPGKYATWGTAYIDHLPVLGQPVLANYFPKHSKEFTETKFKIGEQVQINVNVKTLESLQIGHGEFNPKMSKILGKIGKVRRITGGGDVRVQYSGKPEEHFRWTIHPAALCKVIAFEPGDAAKVLEDEEHVKKLQIHHGGWTDTMRMVLGKVGKVTTQYSDGDVRLSLNGQTWTFNHKCLEKVFTSDSSPNEESLSPDRAAGKKINPFLLDAGRGHVEAVVNRIANKELPLESDVILRALQIATKQNHLSVVKVMSNAYKEMLDDTHNGRTTMQVATLYGNLDIVDYLLSCGADISKVDKDGDNCLHYAVIGKQPTVLEFLVERGLDVNKVNKKKCSPLHYAVNGQSEECLRVLLKHRIQVNLQDEVGDTALHDAIKKQISPETLDLMINDEDLDPSLVNNKGFNCLQLAAMKGNALVTKGILNRFPGLVNVKKNDGFAPIHLSCLNGSVEVTKLLLIHPDTNVDVTDNMGRTALHHASHQGFYKIVQLLLHNGDGSDVRIKDLDDNQPMHLALKKERLATSESTISNAAENVEEAIMTQVVQAGVSEPWRKPVSIALILILKGADPKERNREGQSCFDLISDPNARSMLLEKCLSSADLGAPDESDESGEQIECNVCSELCVPMLFRPCGHKIVCMDCSSRMKKCLTCKASITEKVDLIGNKLVTKSNVKVKDLEAKLRDYEDQYLCSICMERKKNVMFLCGHGACNECVETLKSCHMCRVTIKKKINFY